MKPTVIFGIHFELPVAISLLMSIGCAHSLEQPPQIVGFHCSITWDKSNDPKVTGYQVTVIEQSKGQKKIVRFIPARSSNVSCKDAGADHAGTWDVTVQSCYDKSTCGSPTDITRMRIAAP